MVYSFHSFVDFASIHITDNFRKPLHPSDNMITLIKFVGKIRLCVDVIADLVVEVNWQMRIDKFGSRCPWSNK